MATLNAMSIADKTDHEVRGLLVNHEATPKTGGGGRAAGAKANAAQRRGPGGWEGENNTHDWPKATDQKPCAKRLTNALLPPRATGRRCVGRASDRGSNEWN